MILQLAEGKFSHKDGPDGRFHTVVCRGCSKSGHLKRAGKVELGGGRTSHAFQCENCGETTRVVNRADEQIKAGGSEDNNVPAKKLEEAADSLKKAATPKPFSTSKTSNWVAKGGGLPPYIQHIAHALVDKRGMTESKAIQIAIGTVKRWAKGVGNVDENTRAAAAKAVAQWEKLKAKAAGKRAAKTAKGLAEAVELEEMLALEEGALELLIAEALEQSMLLELAEDAPMGFEVGDPVRRYGPDDHGLWGLGEQGQVIAENVDPEGAYIYDVRWPDGVQHGARQSDLRNVKDMALTEARGTKAKAAIPKPKEPKGDETSPEPEATGDRVGHLQRRLTSLGFEVADDGQFGPLTRGAVKDFQRNAILVPDGLVGPKTTEALAGAPTPEDMASADTDGDGVPDGMETTTDATGREATAVNRSSGATAETLYKGLGVGVDTPHVGVASMQQRLQKAGYGDLQADGRFGPETEKIVKRFQRKWGLRADGMFGQKTGKTLDDVVVKTEQLAEAIDVRSSTSGIDFVRAFGRELSLRRQLEEGNSGLEAMIAKLVAQGIPETQAKAIAAKNIGGTASTKSGSGHAIEMRRMPNGMFAPKGQGEILKVGDVVKVPHAQDKANAKGQLVAGKVTNVDKIGTAHVELDDGPDKGQPFQVAAAHNPAWSAAGSDTATGAGVEAAADSVKARVAAATAKHGSPAVPAPHITPAAEATGPDEGLASSPGRGPTGKLRNFKAMSSTKLKKTIADLTAYGKDDEALAAVKAVAKEKGVAWGESDKPEGKPIKTAYPPTFEGVKAEAADKAAGNPEPEKKHHTGDKPSVKSYDPKTGPSAAEKAANAATMKGSKASPKDSNIAAEDAALVANAAMAKTLAGLKEGSNVTVEMKDGSTVAGTIAPYGAGGAGEYLVTPADGSKPVPFAPLMAKSVAVGAPAATPAKQSKPSAMMKGGPKAGGGKGPSGVAPLPETLSPNVGGLSLHELPLGAQFSLADGQTFHTHKHVGDPWMIAKPVDGGPAKPFHKMLAPPNIGPQVGGYDGATAEGTGATATPASEDDLAAQLAQSVDIAKKAKAEGKKADFKPTVSGSAAADGEAAPSATAAALAAYQAAGGNDPVVIAALKAAATATGKAAAA